MRLQTLCGTLVLAFALAAPAGAATVTVRPAGSSLSNSCYVFGIVGTGGAEWTPYAGYVYKNIPAFALAPGDTIAFDTHATNDADIHLNVALAATASNGAPDPVGAFTQVVSNTQTAASPRGNTVPNDFDLKFKAEAPFSFPGGGLVIRFSNPSGAFASDTTCPTGNLGGAIAASDSSGFFVQSFYRDTDGTYPWDHANANDIGSFQIVNAPPPAGQNTVDTTKPVLGALRLSSTRLRAAKSGASFSKKRPKVGTTVRFSLSEPSSVRFNATRKAKGRKVGRKCVARKRSNRKKKACSRWVKVKGSFTYEGRLGDNSFKFRGRIGGKRLKPGSYRLYGRATDPSKNKSLPERVSFTIVK